MSRYSHCIVTGLSAWLAGKCVTIQSDCIVTGGTLGWKSVSRYNLLYCDRRGSGQLGVSRNTVRNDAAIWPLASGDTAATRAAVLAGVL